MPSARGPPTKLSDMTRPLPLPPPADVDAAVAWVRAHLGHLVAEAPGERSGKRGGGHGGGHGGGGHGSGGHGEVAASPRFRGGQTAADATLATLDVTGYARDRNEVLPDARRGATAVSPYVRHGLLSLPQLWAAVADAPPRDRTTYRDELLWQEYARHLYARVGADSRLGLRRELRGRPGQGNDPAEVWDRSMACLDVTVGELERDGYLVNQTRMWLASHWAVREEVDWRAGEDVFFRHLLDGSRAANRAGWQWTVGTATGKAYGFSRWQVEKRAPGLCERCPLASRCPIDAWPEDPVFTPAAEPPRLRRDHDPASTAGPSAVEVVDGGDGDGRGDGDGGAEVAWLTAESLGDADPALAAHPDLPAVFVFDAPLLARLRLSGKRLVFLTETLADLATRRDVEVHVGDPVEVLQGRRLAATVAPVPGWRRRAARLTVAVRHPWPWLVRPHGGSVASFSAWRKAAERARALPRMIGGGRA
jgi:deoxyribodipyrimidine photo-lyase